MNAILLVSNAILIFAIVWVYYGRYPTLGQFYWPGLIARIAGAVGMAALYKYYYLEGDTLNFFHDGVVLADVFRHDPDTYFSFLLRGDEHFAFWHEILSKDVRSLFLIKIVSVLCIMTGDQYLLVAIYFALLSFWASWRLLQRLVNYFPQQKTVFVIALLFIPSVVVWNSGILKDTLTMVATLWLIDAFIRLWMRDSLAVTEWLVLSVMLIVLFYLKYYNGVLLVPILFGALVWRWFEPRLVVHKLLFAAVSVIGVSVTAAMVAYRYPNFHPDNFLAVIVKHHDLYREYSRPDAVVHYCNLQPTMGSVLLNAPWALVSCLFRPFPGEGLNLLSVAASVENVVILILTMAALTRLGQAWRSVYRILFFAIVSYVVIQGVFLGLSAPNLGSLSRYRTAFLPFYAILILLNNPLIARILKFTER